jgi:hypothetical protein
VEFHFNNKSDIRVGLPDVTLEIETGEIKDDSSSINSCRHAIFKLEECILNCLNT